MLGETKFKNENIFSIAFATIFLKTIQKYETFNEKEWKDAIDSFKDAIINRKNDIELFELFEYLNNLCSVSPKPFVLLIDEVDSARNNQIFLDFLAQLRAYYLKRDSISTFV